MEKPFFEPLGNRYLVLPDPVKDESEDVEGIKISTPPDPNKVPDEGTVVAKGKKCTDLDVRDKIFYGKFSGYDQKLGGVDFKVLQENEILGRRIVTPFDDECARCGQKRIDADNVFEDCSLHKKCFPQDGRVL